MEISNLSGNISEADGKKSHAGADVSYSVVRRSRLCKRVNMQKSNQQGSKAIVLIHGGFVDGSGWAGVYNILKQKGYNVAVVQNPTKSLAEDVAFTKSAIDSMKK